MQRLLRPRPFALCVIEGGTFHVTSQWVITIAELRAIANARLDDASVLFQNDRLDGAVYLCGYAIELSLKARICTTLGWLGFPVTRSEFENLASFKTHKLDVLLLLSGLEQLIKTKHLEQWSAVSTWDPEARYKSVGHTTSEQAELMLFSTILLSGVI
ncbi:MAG: hypothetical protein DMF56_16880 [Acidobacteria bacterium]|nr:MAG: hypothetical protein DMF56_16880 [Acidobacteriota bacterium]